MNESITILSVNWNAYDFAILLLESVKKYTSKKELPVVIVNNSTDKSYSLNHYSNIEIIEQSSNIGHGQGINIGLQYIRTKYVLVLDIDCHFLNPWEFDLLRFVEYLMPWDTTPIPDLITMEGSQEKPIRPAFLFMQTHFAKQYDWQSSENYQGVRKTPYGTDVGIAAYKRMLQQGKNIQFLQKFPNPIHLNGFRGESFGIHQPFVFHYWHGSHLRERQEDFPNIDLLREKEMFFNIHRHWMDFSLKESQKGYCFNPNEMI